MYGDLRTAAVDRHRKHLFGDAALEIYETSPAAGETIAGMFTDGWFAHRVLALTDQNSRTAVAGAWQFQIGAAEDWETTQAFMLRAASLKVSDRRWKVKKIEKPIGLSMMWKIRAEIQ